MAKTKQNSNENYDIRTPGVISDVSQSNVCQLQQDEQYYQKKVFLFMQTLKDDYKRLAVIYNACIKAEQDRERRNKEEIDELKKVYNQMQVERTNIKRKRWCRYCESEATYLSSMATNFFCSQECEQKQNDLVNAINDIFEA